MTLFALKSVLLTCFGGFILTTTIVASEPIGRFFSPKLDAELKYYDKELEIEKENRSKSKIDTNKIKSTAFQAGIQSVDTSQSFIHGIIHGKWLYKDSLSRHKVVKRLIKNGIVVAWEGDFVTVSGISKNSFTESGKATSHPINFK